MALLQEVTTSAMFMRRKRVRTSLEREVATHGNTVDNSLLLRSTLYIYYSMRSERVASRLPSLARDHSGDHLAAPRGVTGGLGSATALRCSLVGKVVP